MGWTYPETLERRIQMQIVAETKSATPDGGAVVDRPQKRILLVDDDRFLRKAAQATLRRHGFEVITASDGDEALRRLAEPAQPDLILLDLIMPKVSGFEVLRRLKQDAVTSSIPVIVLSNLGRPGDIREVMDAGAVAYLVKAKITLRELVERVHAALDA